jgi:hypothetical protein
MEWSEVKSRQLKLVSAGIGASAVVAMTALGVALAKAPSGTSNISEPEITTGETVTTTTGQTEIPTSVAEPPVTATPPEGFAMP